MNTAENSIRKKAILKTFLGAGISICMAFILILPVYAGSINVDQNDGSCVTGSGQADPYAVVYCVIQDAIDDALPGDTINVATGTYDEQLLINTRVHLVGDGSSTIIRPSAAPVTGHYDVEINASNSSIMSFVFDFNGGTGLVDGSRGGTMGQFTGIVISDLNGPDVTGVHLSGNKIYTAEEGTGVQTGKNANIGGLTLDYNTFYGDADGLGEGVYVNPLKATATYGINIISNNFYGNLYSGVSIESSDVVVKKNIIYSDTAKGTYGVRFIDLTGGVTFDGVQIGGPNSADTNYISNFVNAIRVGTASDVSSTLTATIQNNWIEGNDQGIWARYGADLTITGNTFNSNPVQVMDAHGELALGTVFGSNSFDLSAYHSGGTAIFSSIQDAIDDPAVDQTVSVGPGTYVEDLVIAESLTSLNLVGAGSGSTTIKGVANMAAASWPIVAPNIEVLADGVSIHDFTIEGPDPAVGYYSSGIVIGGNDLEVYNNAFLVPNAASFGDISQGIQTYSGANNPTTGGVGGLSIHDNSFTDFGSGTYGYEGIYVNSDVGDPTPTGLLVVDSNTFGGDIVRAITSERSNVEITGNTILTDLAPSPCDFSAPFGWQGVNLPAAQDITLTGNTVNGFCEQVSNGGGALDLGSAFTANTFDLSAYASYGSAIFSSVQDALDDAMDGDTITVGAGTYTEDLVIDQSLDGIYLVGAGSGSTTIKGVANEPIASWPLAVPNIEVLASNVTVHGFTFQGPDPEVGYYASGMVIGGEDFEVYDNAFEVPNADSIDEISQAIVTYSQANNPTGGDLGGVNIHDNTFTDFGAGTFGFEGIYINPTATSYVELTMLDNTFSGDVLRAITTERSNVSITGNTINTDLPLQTSPYDFDGPGAYQGINVVAPSDVTVAGNTVNGFWKQVNNSGGALTLSAVAASNTFDKSAYASSGSAIFSSVQDAIDGAAPADTVSVGAGTYLEDLVIPDGLTDLELVGTGSGSTTIKGVIQVAAADWPLAAPNIEVLADGVSIHDFTIEGPDPAVGYYSSGMVIGGNDFEVYDNAFLIPNAASFDDIAQGIQTYSGANNPTTGGIGGFSIHDNSFTDFGAGTYGYEGIYINSDVGDPTPAGLVVIDSNTFGGDIVRAITTERSNVEITGNMIATDLPASPCDFSAPFGWQGVNLPAAQDITLTGNTINGFCEQVNNSGGALPLSSVAALNSYDLRAFASSGSAIFSSVQDAIDDASPGDLVSVGAGTYVEDLVIPMGKDNLELMGGASGTTIIKGVAIEPIASWPLAVPNIEVLADGVYIHGFTIQGPDPAVGYYASGMLVGGDDLEVSDNIFEVPNAAGLDEISQAIVTYRDANNPTGGDVDGFNIHHNTFTGFGVGAAGFEAIFINHTLSDPTPGAAKITDNTFTGDVLRAITTERSNVSITGNTILTDMVPSDLSGGFGGYQGINIRDYDGRNQQNVTVTGNTVGGSGAGLGFYEGIRVGQNEDQVMYSMIVTGNTYPGDNTTDLVRYDQLDAIGLYDPVTSIFYLKPANEMGWDGVNLFKFGPPGGGRKSIVGDWDGNGTDTIGLFDPVTSLFYLKPVNEMGWDGVNIFKFGPPDDGRIPIAGDWNGDGIDTVGLYDPATSIFYLKPANEGGWDGVNIFKFGPPDEGRIPIVGDWDGDGTDTIGLYDPATSIFYLKPANETGWDGVYEFKYGPAGGGRIPIIGDWDEDGTDTIGLFDPVTSLFYLKPANETGWDGVSIFKFGPPAGGRQPIAGDW